MAHAAARAVLHLGVLHVIARLRKESVIARMIKMHVRNDDVFDAIGIDPDNLQSFSHRTKQSALSLRSAGSVEAGIEDEALLLSDHGPNKIVERHGAVVRIAAKKIMRRGAMVMAVADCEQIVGFAQEGTSTVLPAGCLGQ